MRLKCLFCLRKSNWILCFCCRNVVLLFSLFIVLVEGDIDSSGGVKSHLSLLIDNLSKMSLMNLPVLMKVFLHFADAGIHATSTGKYLCAFSTVSISSLYCLTCFCLTCIIFYLCQTKILHLMKLLQVSVCGVQLWIIFQIKLLSSLVLYEEYLLFKILQHHELVVSILASQQKGPEFDSWVSVWNLHVFPMFASLGTPASSYCPKTCS